ncbi:hypothetical protein WOLCODRAFT_166759 [Wolfiporia cocos MD-104 SS10]|uniref:DUF202 domain-containing protein n=1 Tax=Wolfiporia cocos (strain MD-104) TaxID=742152 RepID=A0A2H3J1T6_WOLCO|nr:hypothetical protein WOLCODRAFT_166759 [Wolfiporia cocos MD-104 SS10]
MPAIVENTGSTTRDFLMLERNLLSHVKLGMLLSLLSSSIILKTRITGNTSGGDPTKIQIPIGSVEFAAALCAIGAGLFQYFRSCKDIRSMRGFLVATKIHFVIMAVVATVVFTTCVVLLAEEPFAT